MAILILFYMYCDTVYINNTNIVVVMLLSFVIIFITEVDPNTSWFQDMIDLLKVLDDIVGCVNEIATSHTIPFICRRKCIILCVLT